MKICWLELSSFVGTSPEAVHTYGVFRLRDTNDGAIQTEDVTRPLTTEEADEMNAKSPAAKLMPAKAGYPTHSFFTEADVIGRAVVQFYELWPNADFPLILGDFCVADPQLVLLGEEPVKSMVNEWVDRLQKARAENDLDGENAACDEYWEWLHGHHER